jgi:hypothetical protein
MNVVAFDGDRGWQIWDEKRWALGPASRAAQRLFCRLCVRSLHCPRVHPDKEFCISGRDHRWFVELVWIRVVRTIAVLVASFFNFWGLVFWSASFESFSALLSLCLCFCLCLFLPYTPKKKNSFLVFSRWLGFFLEEEAREEEWRRWVCTLLQVV